jgi:hypothetical protein
MFLEMGLSLAVLKKEIPQLFIWRESCDVYISSYIQEIISSFTSPSTVSLPGYIIAVQIDFVIWMQKY